MKAEDKMAEQKNAEVQKKKEEISTSNRNSQSEQIH